MGDNNELSLEDGMSAEEMISKGNGLTYKWVKIKFQIFRNIFIFFFSSDFIILPGYIDFSPDQVVST